MASHPQLNQKRNETLSFNTHLPNHRLCIRAFKLYAMKYLLLTSILKRWVDNHNKANNVKPMTNTFRQ